jgi:hypothetical protein
MAPVEAKVVDEDSVEKVIVVLVPDQAVLQKRERRAVRDREVAEQVVATCEQRLEEIP